MALMAFTLNFQPTWRDMDALGHVNNAVYSTWLENARDKWWHEVVGAFDLFPFMLARTEIDFRRAVTWRDPLKLSMRVSKIGHSSFELTYAVVDASGNAVADAKTVMVFYDHAAKKSVPIPDEIRKKLKAYER
jgi:acyl-CoA thioester hydrolase